MAMFKVVLERTDTLTKLAEITVEAASADEAQRQIQHNLEVDPDAYDDDLEPVENGVGETTIRVESQHEDRTQFPRAVAGGRH
jgi:hypothetical protein